MPVRLTIGLVAALAGILTAIAAVLTLQNRHPQVVVSMDNDLPRLTFGFYPVERAGALTFAWTGERASVTLAGANRKVDWTCAVTVRGAHPDTVPPAIVVFDVDGRATPPRMLGNEFETVSVAIPARAEGSGFRLGLRAEPTFVPGPGDRRRLGVQVDEIRCTPSGWLVPSAGPMVRAALPPAAFGLALGASGAAVALAVPAAMIVALLQAIPMTTGPGPYSTAYLDALVWIGCVLAAVVAAITAAVAGRRPARSLNASALLMIAVPAIVAYLQLAGLLHPLKAPIDAGYHMHRLEWVLDGRWYFTQTVRGVQFPYAIGLYAVAAPFGALTTDYVLLLRIVSVAAQAIACGVVGVLAARGWDLPRAGALAVLLFSLVPLPYEMLHNANLTNVFAQAAATWTMAGAILLPLTRTRIGTAAGWTAVATLALLSHFSTLTLLTVTLVSLAGLYVWRGDTSLRQHGLVLGGATMAALVAAVLLYYGHFPDTYRSFMHARADAPASTLPGAGTPALSADTSPGLRSRMARAGEIAVHSYGWPLLLFAAAGLVVLARRGARDRLGLALGAWLIGYLVFTGAGTVPPLDPRYVRYADEFLARTTLATSPAIVVLAAAGADRLVRSGTAGRVVAATLIAWAGVTVTAGWVTWLQ